MLASIGFLSFVLFSQEAAARSRGSHIFNLHLSRGVEELHGAARMPSSVSRCEIYSAEMSKDTRHDHSAVSPWLAKGKVEVVVLYIVVSMHISLQLKVRWYHLVDLHMSATYRLDLTTA